MRFDVNYGRSQSWKLLPWILFRSLAISFNALEFLIAVFFHLYSSVLVVWLLVFFSYGATKLMCVPEQIEKNALHSPGNMACRLHNGAPFLGRVRSPVARRRAAGRATTATQVRFAVSFAWGFGGFASVDAFPRSWWAAEAAERASSEAARVPERGSKEEEEEFCVEPIN